MDEKATTPNVIIVMGVSGCGKSTVGTELARVLGWDFIDGDEFHPQENIDKMSCGVPLTDADRSTWLAGLHNLIVPRVGHNRPMILACSALKQAYRNQLTEAISGTRIVYLRGDFDLIFGRMQNRADHFMKAEMLKSQFKDLEEPRDALTIDIQQDVKSIVEEITNSLDLI